ncbi:uncharacterized protein BT62DRAFT_1007157 [Guyanagaster necrorhizus]|uniref:Uncharacterized protein n=1 Tax=Guyanagaster necrorhizus TaxID=856835 RepID=A0A9P7VRR9_9AGAR|nr:uncharacterized protein BT62DRAFT_1007157 [Guyanagaster necrorhizus MCA 3950]KAG7445407.1 hypothetical protein BT62DRAFT_1007157 [Guyanagaster necrorhizus MCA 3950]
MFLSVSRITLPLPLLTLILEGFVATLRDISFVYSLLAGRCQLTEVVSMTYVPGIRSPESRYNKHQLWIRQLRTEQTKVYISYFLPSQELLAVGPLYFGGFEAIPDNTRRGAATQFVAGVTGKALGKEQLCCRNDYPENIVVWKLKTTIIERMVTLR